MPHEHIQYHCHQLASALPYVDKVLFVVDRKDLDYQTMKEYDRFEKGSANSNASTRVLQRQLEDRDEKGGYHQYKIIITTIQKLDNFVTKNKGHEVFNKHCVTHKDQHVENELADISPHHRGRSTGGDNWWRGRKGGEDHAGQHDNGTFQQDRCIAAQKAPSDVLGGLTRK